MKTRTLFLLACVSIFLLSAIFLWPYLFSTGPSDWMDRRIAKDFARFEKEGISRELVERSWAKCKKNSLFRRFQIIQSKVYCDGPHSRVREFLEELVQKYPVPDVDFIWFNEDHLTKRFFKRSIHRDGAPLFVSAKEQSLDRAILFCDWTYDLRDQEKGWNFLIRKINEEYEHSPWAEKMETLFWRGTPWDGKHFGMYDFDTWKTIPRGRLVFESCTHPDLIDAAFSEYPKKCTDQDPQRCIREMGPIRYVPWEQVVRYKYQLLIDGVTCAFPATQWKLLSGCVPFKQHSKNIQFFYDELIAWKHYIPVRSNMSDLTQKIRWAKAHDEKAQQIAENARTFALTHLMPEHMQLYCYKVLVKYASLQKFQPSH